ncbi:hypothetical protein E2C01_023822 [Portunus trituberculatus]|uniref:Uncharacterized protein n=1 Tax=Portunus trituberculatus TaxID=210409 RepID=A0A5B7EB29_PORTR|nr:hypothetical protein [Portunus trituberculatus]
MTVKNLGRKIGFAPDITGSVHCFTFTASWVVSVGCTVMPRARVALGVVADVAQSLLLGESGWKEGTAWLPFRENGLFKSVSHDCDDIVTRGREEWEGGKEGRKEGTHLEQATRAPVASSSQCTLHCPTSLLPLPPPGKERVFKQICKLGQTTLSTRNCPDLISVEGENFRSFDLLAVH